MSKRDIRRKLFLDYLKSNPKCLFVYGRGLRGCPLEGDIDKPIETWGELKDELVTRVTSFRIQPTGIVALFPGYLAFLTKGNKDFPWGTVFIKGTLGGLFDSFVDYYELGEAIIETGLDAFDHAKKEKCLDIKDAESWLTDSHSFVIPVSQIDSIIQMRKGVYIIEKDRSMYALYSPPRIISWNTKLIKAYEALTK